MSSREHHRKKMVPRDKYEKVKSKGEEWYLRAQELNVKYEKLLEELKQIKLTQPDADMISSLEQENKEQRKEIRSMKQEMREYENKIAILERDLILKDGKIQQLTEAKEDLRERYKDLKTDFREQQRWARGTTQE